MNNDAEENWAATLPPSRRALPIARTRLLSWRFTPRCSRKSPLLFNRNGPSSTGIRGMDCVRIETNYWTQLSAKFSRIEFVWRLKFLHRRRIRSTPRVLYPLQGGACSAQLSDVGSASRSLLTDPDVCASSCLVHELYLLFCWEVSWLDRCFSFLLGVFS